MVTKTRNNSIANERPAVARPCEWCDERTILPTRIIPAYVTLPDGRQIICQKCWPLLTADSTGKGPAIRRAMVEARLAGSSGDAVREAGKRVLHTPVPLVAWSEEGGEAVPPGG